jgi:hypothetical protein
MADDIEARLGRIEMNFDEYMTMFYKWLDELRTDMKLLQADMRDIKEIQVLLAENDRKIIETQRIQAEDHGMLVRLFQSIDRKLDNHDDRLSRAGI